MDEETARSRADAEVATWHPHRTDPDDEVVVWKLEEHSRAWVAYFATRRWLRSRDRRDQLVGSCPLVIDKVTAHVHRYGSAPAQYALYEAWLDATDD
ncbi:YrhB domain-containing protein [Spongisporangium articulatum]|uniref:YrhB domain-containing protein n=1 Tax=Spongisporangium articulatum TaxID=3362603 RepID=A0ABW8AQA0_9ACTN